MSKIIKKRIKKRLFDVFLKCWNVKKKNMNDILNYSNFLKLSRIEIIIELIYVIVKNKRIISYLVLEEKLKVCLYN